jgi:hypothetical protein
VSGQQYAGEKVGFIGLGNMGKGMAKNLIEKVRTADCTPHRNIKISHRYMSVGIVRQNIIILFWK